MNSCLITLGLQQVTAQWKNEGSQGRRLDITAAEVTVSKKAKQKSLFNTARSKPSAQQ